MAPTTHDLDHGRRRVEPLDLAVEPAGLHRLVDDDAVGGAPPDRERHARVGDPAGEVERAAGGPRAGTLPRRAADLVPRELLQARPVAEPGELAVAQREVRRRVEGD